MVRDACDPRTAVFIFVAAALAGLVSVRSALLSLVAVGVWLVVATTDIRSLARRGLPLLGAFATLLVLAPLAPQAVGSATVRGLAVSVAAIALSAVVSRTGIIAAFQGVGLPRSVAAFLIILGCHADATHQKAHRAWQVVLMRGGWHRPRRFHRSIAILLSVILASAFDRADHVARALDLRGFRGRLPALAAFRFRLSEAGHYALALALALVVLWEATSWRH